MYANNLHFLCSNSNVQPLVIAAHPQEPYQFAIGLSDGGVHVFEPLESEGKWGVPPPDENGSASSVAATPSVGTSGSDQPQRWSSSCQAESYFSCFACWPPTIGMLLIKLNSNTYTTNGNANGNWKMWTLMAVFGLWFGGGIYGRKRR